MGMGSITRLSLARQAYRVALEAARADSTPRTWARLLRASRNLREAQTRRPPAAGATHPQD